MKFEDSGFLSKEAERISDDIYEKNINYFEFYMRVNNKATALLYSIDVKGAESQKLVAFLYLIRVLQSGQASYILLKNGVEDEVATVIRSMFESYLKLRNIIEFPDFWERLGANSEFENLKKAKNMKKFFAPSDSPVSEDLDEIIKMLENNVYTDEQKRISIRDMCKDIKEESLYVTLYNLTSDSAHNSLNALSKYVEIDDGIIKSIIFGPNDEMLKTHFIAMSEMLIVAIKKFSEHCEMDLAEEWNSYLIDLKEMESGSKG